MTLDLSVTLPEGLTKRNENGINLALNATELKKFSNCSPGSPIVKETILTAKRPGSFAHRNKSGYNVDEYEKSFMIGPEQHVLVISADLLSKEDQKASEKDTTNDMNNHCQMTVPSPPASLPSMGRLDIETPRLFDKYDTGIKNLPLQRERVVAQNGIKFNLMIAGQAGLGKTTFVNTLFDTCLLLPRQKVDNYGSGQTKCVEIHRVLLEVGNFNLDLNIIDTPGFGYKIDNTFDWVPLISYVDEQLRRYIFQEEQPYRDHLEDNRVHCCLYFIEPSGKGLSTLDVIAMRELSKRVNLIPIISKADGLSCKELSSFKKEIRDIMDSQGIKACRFLEENDESCRDIFENLPFAIVGSERKQMDREDYQPVHVRKTRWGIIEVENVDHCDFTILKNVLISNNSFDLIHATECYYESCRSSVLRTRILKVRDLLNGTTLSQDLVNDLQKLSYDDIDSNGLKNYICYSVFGKKELDSLVAEGSPEFIQKKWQLRKKLHQVILLEDHKFQEWKRALQNKQMTFNQELESLRQRIDHLQLECRGLEAQILSAKAVRTSRSKSTK